MVVTDWWSVLHGLGQVENPHLDDPVKAMCTQDKSLGNMNWLLTKLGKRWRIWSLSWYKLVTVLACFRIEVPDYIQ